MTRMRNPGRAIASVIVDAVIFSLGMAGIVACVWLLGWLLHT